MGAGECGFVQDGEARQRDPDHGQDACRARVAETNAAIGDVLTEHRYHIDDDPLRAEPAGDKSGQVVLRGTDAWTF